MSYKFLFIIIFGSSFYVCLKLMPLKDEEIQIPQEDNFNKEHEAFSFDFPLGKPDGKGYYNAQIFGENNHLGEDWNGIEGGNSDYGDSIFSIGNGKVIFAKDVKGGWGKVIKIKH